MYLYFCLDINECAAGTHDCGQVCTNTDGSFTCSCNSGYTLDSNGKTCNGVCVFTINCG